MAGGFQWKVATFDVFTGPIWVEMTLQEVRNAAKRRLDVKFSDELPTDLVRSITP